MAYRARLHYTDELKSEIWDKYQRGDSLWSIARSINRSSSTVSREIKRHGGGADYRATQADQQAWHRALRPKRCKLVRNRALSRIVENKLKLHWSPEQIAGWLKRTFPSDEHYQVAHQTTDIYFPFFAFGGNPHMYQILSGYSLFQTR